MKFKEVEAVDLAKVALVRCETYDYTTVKEAVEMGFKLLGGCAQFAFPGEKILLKPNLLAPNLPEKCVTTHPAVFKAVAEVFLSREVKLSYGDSPAIGSPLNVARKAGIASAAEEIGIPLANFTEGRKTPFPEGFQHKSFIIATGAAEADALISISKLKTHGLTRLTGAIKNQFGCIPGILKGEFHAKLPDLEQFASMLVDLNLLLRPRLYIMDGITAMEGNGPRGGRPKQMNVLFFSSDPVALDATVCRMVGINPAKVATIIIGHRHGLGEFAEEQIELVGDSFDSFVTEDFAVARPGMLSGIKSKRLRNMIVPRPVIIDSRCIACGICSNVCPVKPKALLFMDNEEKKPPEYDYNECIRCYCCQELCPEGAIEIITPFMGRILTSFQ